MTLVAAVKHLGNSLLVSDILQTETHSAKPDKINHKPVALYNNVDSILSEEHWRTVVDPIQKSYIISDNFCVGVCGKSIPCWRAVELLSENFSGKSVSLDELSLFLTTSIPRNSEIWLIGWVASAGTTRAFRWESKSNLFSTGDHFVEGTGAEAFSKAIGPDYNHTFSGPSYLTAVEASKLWLMGQIAELTYLQMSGGNFLLSEFGGGFQAIYHDGQAFKFIDRYTLLYCRGKVYKDGSYDFSVGGPLIFQKYIDKQFNVIRFDIPKENSSDNKLYLKNSKTTIKTATNWLGDAESKPQEEETSDLTTDYYLFPIWWEVEDSKPHLSSSVSQSVDAGPFTIRIGSDDQGYFMELGPKWQQFIDNERAQIKHKLRNPLHRSSSNVTFNLRS